MQTKADSKRKTAVSEAEDGCSDSRLPALSVANSTGNYALLALNSGCPSQIRMKQLARKFRPLTLVRPTTKPAPVPKPMRNSLHDHLEDWLNSIDPELIGGNGSRQKMTAGLNTRRPVTPTDLVRVNRATLRESSEHRHWPPDVVQKFMAADVIRRR